MSTGAYHLGHLAPDHVDAFFQDAGVELLVTLAIGAHVDVELEDFGLGAVLDQVGELEGIHAAYP